MIIAKLPVKQSAKQIPIAKFLKISPQIMIIAMKITVLLMKTPRIFLPLTLVTSLSLYSASLIWPEPTEFYRWSSIE